MWHTNMSIFANMTLSSLMPTWTETRNDQNTLTIFFFLVFVPSGHSAPVMAVTAREDRKRGPSLRG
jgi:hypothetical protein